eukprot:2822076-Rhodomonas_salina.1
MDSEAQAVWQPEKSVKSVSRGAIMGKCSLFCGGGNGCNWILKRGAMLVFPGNGSARDVELSASDPFAP